MWLTLALLPVSIIATAIALFSFVLFVHSFSIMFLSGLIETLIWRISLWQVGYTIEELGKLSIAPLVFIMVSYRKTIQYILEINPLYGEVFLVYSVVNFPINSVIVMNILYGNPNTLYLIMSSLITFTQVAVMFLFHFLIAINNAQMHQHSKDIFKLSFRHNPDTKTNVRLNLFIQTFYTEKCYGITYWKFGLVSFSAFGKVSLFSYPFGK